MCTDKVISHLAFKALIYEKSIFYNTISNPNNVNIK